MRTYYIAQGTLLSVLWRPKWEGNPKKRGYKELPADAGDSISIPELGRSPGGGNGNPLQSSHLGSSMDRGAWWTADQEDAESDVTDRLCVHAHGNTGLIHFTAQGKPMQHCKATILQLKRINS